MNTIYNMDDMSEMTYSGSAENVDGMKGGAVNFTGGYVEIPDSFADNSFTFSAWIKPTQMKQWERLFDIGAGQSDYAFLTINCDNYPRFAVKTSDKNREESITSSISLSIGSWSYITVTLNEAMAKLYINGELTASGAITLDLSKLVDGSENYIGKSQFKNDPTYNGCVDEVSIYNYALTEDEIKEDISATMQTVKSIEEVERTVTIGTYIVNGKANIYGSYVPVTATVYIISDSKDENYSIGANINYVKNAGVAHADAIYSITAKDTADNDDLIISLGAYDENDELIGKEVTKTISGEDAKKLNGDFEGARIDLVSEGEITVKSTLKKDGSIIAECERTIINEYLMRIHLELG